PTSPVEPTIPASHGRLPPPRCLPRPLPFPVLLRSLVFPPLPRPRRRATMPRPSAIFPAWCFLHQELQPLHRLQSLRRRRHLQIHLPQHHLLRPLFRCHHQCPPPCHRRPLLVPHHRPRPRRARQCRRHRQLRLIPPRRPSRNHLPRLQVRARVHPCHRRWSACSRLPGSFAAFCSGLQRNP